MLHDPREALDRMDAARRCWCYKIGTQPWMVASRAELDQLETDWRWNAGTHYAAVNFCQCANASRPKPLGATTRKVVENGGGAR